MFDLHHPKEPFVTDYLHAAVKRMHGKFGLDYSGPPRPLTHEEKTFRVGCLREEISEYQTAGSLVDELDALVDLLVFTVGTLERQGLPVREAFEIVMAANSRKEVAGEADRSKRHFAIDLVKPEGWMAPEPQLQSLLDFYGQARGVLVDG